MLNKREVSKYKKAYQEKGYVLVKNFIDKKSCKTALNRLNKKNKKKLAKSWTEQEPGVDLAVLFVVHNLKNNPVSKLANNKKVLQFASELVNDKFFPEFDFVVCNILAEVIIEIIPSIFAVLSNKGQVILSGIIESKKYEIIKALDSNKFNVENLTSKNDWICIKASKVIKKL